MGKKLEEADRPTVRISPTDPDPLMRAADFGDRLGVSRVRAYAILRSGDVPGVVRIGRSVYLPESAYRAYIQKHAATGAE